MFNVKKGVRPYYYCTKEFDELTRLGACYQYSLGANRVGIVFRFTGDKKPEKLEQISRIMICMIKLGFEDIPKGSISKTLDLMNRTAFHNNYKFNVALPLRDMNDSNNSIKWNSNVSKWCLLQLQYIILAGDYFMIFALDDKVLEEHKKRISLPPTLPNGAVKGRNQTTNSGRCRQRRKRSSLRPLPQF